MAFNVRGTSSYPKGPSRVRLAVCSLAANGLRAKIDKSHRDLTGRDSLSFSLWESRREMRNSKAAKTRSNLTPSNDSIFIRARRSKKVVEQRLVLQAHRRAGGER